MSNFTNKSFDHILPSEIIYTILSYSDNRNILISLSSVNKNLRKLLQAEECAYNWDILSPKPFEICIDGYCPNCQLTKHLLRNRKAISHALDFIEKFPIRRLQIHCFISDIPICIKSLAYKPSLTSLDLSLTNKSNSPSLEKILTDSNSEINQMVTNQAFKSLKELYIDSAHLQHVKLAGRSKLLDLLGVSLERLIFRNLSPSGVFSILSARCPHLKYIRVDKMQTLPDFQNYFNDKLEHLELCRCNIVLPHIHKNFPNLKKLRFSSIFRLESVQIIHIISHIPATVTDLCLEVPSSLSNIAINAISECLPNLVHLTIEGSYDNGNIDSQSLKVLGEHCKHLESIQILSRKSVNTLGFNSSDSFTSLGNNYFSCLKSFKVRFEPLLIEGLVVLLKKTKSINKITLWERQNWMGEVKWKNIKRYLDSLSCAYPNVTIELEDVSQNPQN